MKNFKSIFIAVITTSLINFVTLNIELLTPVYKSLFEESFQDQVKLFESSSFIVDDRFDEFENIFFKYNTSNFPKNAYYYITASVNGVPVLDKKGRVWRIPPEGMFDTAGVLSERDNYERWGTHPFGKNEVKKGDEIQIKFHFYQQRHSNLEIIAVLDWIVG